MLRRRAPKVERECSFPKPRWASLVGKLEPGLGYSTTSDGRSFRLRWSGDRRAAPYDAGLTATIAMASTRREGAKG